MQSKQHYVYQIIHLLYALRYIGTRSCYISPEEDLGIHYFSSSHDKEFMKEQFKYPERFRYEILQEFGSREEALEYETKLHRELEVDKNLDFYNRSRQSGKEFHCDMTGRKHSEKSKENHSKASKKINAKIKEDVKRYEEWKTNISKSRKGKGGGPKNNNARAVIQVNVKSRKIVAEYETMTKACELNSISKTSSIVGSCNERFFQTGDGSTWFYKTNKKLTQEEINKRIDDFYQKHNEKMLKKKKNCKRGDEHHMSKPVKQIDLKTGEVLKIWPSSASVCKEIGITGVRAVLNGIQKTSGGFGWECVV